MAVAMATWSSAAPPAGSDAARSVLADMGRCYTDPCHIKRGTLGSVSDVTEAPERIDADGEGELTIDELAQRTGMTVRNIRAHQSRGLLPPPAVRGRTGYYGPAHLARIELIQEMQAQGFNLQAIRRLVDAAPSSSEEPLRFLRAVAEAYVSDAPQGGPGGPAWR